MRYFFILIYLFLLVLPVPGIVYADFFKYSDEKGTIHITNDVKRVPKKFRSQAEIIKEGEKIRKKLLEGKYVLDEAAEKMSELKVEAEKLWWRWIVDPNSGKTKAPAILGGYILIALVTIITIRNHVTGKAYRLLMKYLCLGFIAVIALTYSAQRAQTTYSEYKNSNIKKFLSAPEINLDKY